MLQSPVKYLSLWRQHELKCTKPHKLDRHFFWCRALPCPHFSQPLPPGWVGILSPTRPATSSGLRSPLLWYRLCRTRWLLVDISKHRYVCESWWASNWARQYRSPVTCQREKKNPTQNCKKKQTVFPDPKVTPSNWIFCMNSSKPLQLLY